jgi:hypothetical protein
MKVFWLLIYILSFIYILIIFPLTSAFYDSDYDLTFNELTELLENLGIYLDMEDIMMNAVCALDNIYNGEEE